MIRVRVGKSIHWSQHWELTLLLLISSKLTFFPLFELILPQLISSKLICLSPFSVDVASIVLCRNLATAVTAQAKLAGGRANWWWKASAECYDCGEWVEHILYPVNFSVSRTSGRWYKASWSDCNFCGRIWEKGPYRTKQYFSVHANIIS